MQIYFSTVAGGGGRQREAGIALVAMTQGGSTIEKFHLFIEVSHQAGEMTTGIIAGEVRSGNTSELLTIMFNATGINGKKAGIGRNSTIGVSVILSHETEIVDETVITSRRDGITSRSVIIKNKS